MFDGGGRSPALEACVAAVDAFFSAVFHELHDWRELVESTGGRLHAAELDDAVASFAIPALEREDSALIGAGFIGDADPGDGGLHFAWWLGPIPANPLLGETTDATRLDITARGYAEYVRDFATLEWYRVPESTRRAHVTGPYVDHLCTCDYILTVTAPVHIDDEMFGVVGADIFVHRLERAIMPELLAVGQNSAVVNQEGRVVVSTATDLAVGAILEAEDKKRGWEEHPCERAPFSVVVRRK